MRFIRLTLFLCALTSIMPAQQWEAGVGGGYGFLNHVDASGAAGRATAGFAPGYTLGAYFKQDFQKRLFGQIRYEYMQSNLRLSSGGRRAEFSGRAHAIHYDFGYQTTPEGSRPQFFAAVGGGVKIFTGDGTESAVQPLSQFGFFTNTSDVKPLFTSNAGVSFRLREHVVVRAEIQNYLSPFPRAVLTPAPGVRFGKVLDDVVPMITVGFGR